MRMSARGVAARRWLAKLTCEDNTRHAAAFLIDKPMGAPGVRLIERVL